MHQHEQPNHSRHSCSVVSLSLSSFAAVGHLVLSQTDLTFRLGCSAAPPLDRHILVAGALAQRIGRQRAPGAGLARHPGGRQRISPPLIRIDVAGLSGSPRGLPTLAPTAIASSVPTLVGLPPIGTSSGAG
jgi:hypothetical protein